MVWPVDSEGHGRPALGPRSEDRMKIDRLVAGREVAVPPKPDDLTTSPGGLKS